MDVEMINSGKCLMQKTKLKELKLQGNRDLFCTIDSTRNAKFKLKTFTNQSEVNYPTKPLTRLNFDSFVMLMAEPLTVLIISSCFPEDLDLALNKFHALTRFETSRFQENMNVIKLKPNVVIKELKCQNLNSLPEEVLACFAGLEVLEVMMIDKTRQGLNGACETWILWRS